jgi:hypothetical protein
VELMRTLPLGLPLGLLPAPLLVQPTDVTARTRVSPTTSELRVSMAYLAVRRVYITHEFSNAPRNRARADKRMRQPDGPTMSRREASVHVGDTIEGV